MFELFRYSNGQRQVVRNGYAQPRTVVTGLGPVEVQMPRVHDRGDASKREKFTSSILPPYLRKAKSVEELVPWLYLKGVSPGDFTKALQHCLARTAPASARTRSRD